MRESENRAKSGFSLLEVVIVVAILAILAAIAIPRLSRGTSGACDSALKSNLSSLRYAIDLYATEHGGDYPKVATFVDQITLLTDMHGNASESRDSTHVCGPYLRSIPPLTVGAKQGKSGVSADGAGANDGWVYTEATGRIIANTDANEVDDVGVKYNSY